MVKFKLQEARLRKHLSQEELADLVGMTQSTYSRKEKGIIKISLQEWEKLAHVLDIPRDEIYQANIPEKKINIGLEKNPNLHYVLLSQIEMLEKENSYLRKKLNKI